MTTTGTTTVPALRGRVLRTLEPLLRGAARIALIDFPDYANVGDSAIWLGQRAVLRDLGVTVAYTCDRRSYRPETLRRRLGHGVILLSGGGNFGDLYPDHQRLRERVIADFPDTRVIQLPQSIHFRQGGAPGSSRDRLDGHGDLLLLLRDRRSLELARASYRAHSQLCPDMAFGLPAPPHTRRREPAVQDILWLLRADRESADLEGRDPPSGRALGFGTVTTDWPTEPRPLLARWSRRMAERAGGPGLSARGAARLAAATYEPLARSRLSAGCRLLESAAVVVTDRLHGHILCLLLGIPHVLLDNTTGKVRGFHDAWTGTSPLVRWASDMAEAEAVARDLLRRPPAPELFGSWS